MGIYHIDVCFGAVYSRYQRSDDVRGRESGSHPKSTRAQQSGPVMF